MATICVQTGLNPARHILESPCQYVRCHCLNFFGNVCFQGVYGSWFVSVNSPFHVRNNQAASDRASGVVKVHSKWSGHRERTEFRPCWRVKCGMSLRPAGNIQLRVPHRPFDLQKCWRFPYMQLLWWLHRRRRDQLCPAVSMPRVATIRRTADTFLFISHTTNVLLFKFRCNIFIGVRIIKEMPGSVASGTQPCY